MIPALKNVNKTLPALCSGPVFTILTWIYGMQSVSYKLTNNSFENSIESVFDVVQKSHQLCVIEFIHYKNGIKWRFGALKLISVDSSFLLASHPDMCLYSKTYNYLWAYITIRMYVVTELHLNEFMVYIYEHCSCIKHRSRDDSVHALIHIFFIALIFLLS